jgi:hypothetical protein
VIKIWFNNNKLLHSCDLVKLKIAKSFPEIPEGVIIRAFIIEKY